MRAALEVEHLVTPDEEDSLAYVIAVEPDLIRVTLSGAITPQDLTGIMHDTDALERGLDRVPHRLITTEGEIDIQVGYAEVKAFAWHRREIRFPNAFRSALVARTPVQRGIARMLQTLNDNPQIMIEIFDNEAEALAWLRS